MDIGLFIFWWTQVAGTFHQLPVFETGIDQPFIWECAVFAAALTVVLSSILKLLQLRDLAQVPPAARLNPAV
jgi:hypothetical protein